MSRASGPVRGELRFVSAVLLPLGVLFVLLAIVADRISRPEDPFGPLQAIVLATGIVMVVLGVTLPRSSRVRRTVLRLWPFHVGSPERPLRVLGFAVWLGAIGGLLELGVLFLQYEWGHRWTSLNPHSGWMTPLSYVLSTLLLGGLFAFFSARGWRHLGSPQLAAFVLLLWIVAGPLSVYSTELRKVSVALLSLGIAYQGSRWIVGRRERVRAMARRSFYPLVLLLAAAAVGPFAWMAGSERVALAAMPEGRPGAPNILLIVLDTVRAQNMSLYGYARETTPVLEELADRATVYDNAFAPSSWTLPAHASMFTGRPPHQQSGNYGVPLDDRLPTIAEVMRDHGYYTLGVVANLYNAYPHTGLDRGFLRYDAGIASVGEFFLASMPGRLVGWGLRRLALDSPSPARKDAGTVNERFLRLLERRGDRPFFAFLNYMDAHYPFEEPIPPEPPGAKWDPPDVPISGAGRALMMRRIDDYDREIAHLDDQLGSLFEALERRDVLANTVLIVTSDHGEEFTEHGRTSHGWNLYNTSLLVPLLISFPGAVPEGVRVGRSVSLQDLPVTVVGLAGLAGETPFEGRDLVSVAGDSATSSPPLLSELSGNPEIPPEESPGWDRRSLVWGSLHYLLNPDGSEEIYDFREDPWETRDLAGSARGAATLPLFRTALSSLVEGDSREGSLASSD